MGRRKYSFFSPSHHPLRGDAVVVSHDRSVSANKRRLGTSQSGLYFQLLVGFGAKMNIASKRHVISIVWFIHFLLIKVQPLCCAVYQPIEPRQLS